MKTKKKTTKKRPAPAVEDTGQAKKHIWASLPGEVSGRMSTITDEVPDSSDSGIDPDDIDDGLINPNKP